MLTEEASSLPAQLFTSEDASFRPGIPVSMTKKSTMRFLFILLLSGLSLQAAFAQSLRATSVVGTVVDSLTGKPLLEASVSLLSARDSSLVSLIQKNGI